MKSDTYEKLNVKLAFNIAAPHTWPAAVLPVLLAVTYSYSRTGVIQPGISLVLLAIAILMQSSVNTFNDYYDFKKGTDATQDNLEEDDAVLLNHNINPKSVKWLACGFLLGAFALGSYAIYLGGWIPLILGIIGAVFVVIYSAGKTPLSYLPLGELSSGFVMGGLISLACSEVLLRYLDWWVLLWSAPLIIGIALIMMTNNTCDIEKDAKAGRRTLPSISGRVVSRKIYHALLVLWCVSIILIVITQFQSGALFLVFMFIIAFPSIKALYANPLEQPSRIAAMKQICTLNIILGTWYTICILIQ